MRGLAGALTRTPVIIGSFILMLLVGLSFAPTQSIIDGPLLDMVWTGEAAKLRLAEMSDAQRQAHFWATVLNDTAYPFAYGAFFAGLAGRFAPRPWRTGVIVPAGLTMIADLAENTIQALALSGSADLLALKSVLTPLKFGLFIAAALLALAFAVIALANWIRGRRGPAR